MYKIIGQSNWCVGLELAGAGFLVWCVGVMAEGWISDEKIRHELDNMGWL